MKLTAITTALALTASQALACDSYVFHVASYHTDRQLIQDVNEANFGLGCRIDSYEFGGFINSYDDTSAYVLRDFTHDSGFGVFAGVASGYQDDLGVPDHGITAVGGAVYRGEFVTVRATPSHSRATDTKGVVVSLSFSIGGSQ